VATWRYLLDFIYEQRRRACVTPLSIVGEATACNAPERVRDQLTGKIPLEVARFYKPRPEKALIEQSRKRVAAVFNEELASLY